MHAARQLAVLLLLQARGRMSARQVASEVEASVRTIHRDIEALSAAGVPVYAARGAAGGFELVDGWQTRLTGLTALEAEAVMMTGIPGPAADLGLGDAVASARRKLLAALPADRRGSAQRVGARFHLDPAGWFRTAERPGHLPLIAAAVWEQRRVAIRYESWIGVVERTVDALGLVLKAGMWYLVGGTERGPRTYRLSSMLAVTLLDEGFERPSGFDLVAYWEGATERFESGVYRQTAQLRGSPEALARLRAGSPAMARAAEQATAVPNADGSVLLKIPLESIDVAARDLLALGPVVEVLTPPALRRRIGEIAGEVANLYSSDVRATSRAADPPAR